jgi:hypothetical protein
MSAYVVERQDAESSVAVAAELLRQTRDEAVSEEWLRWRYLANPEGRAAVWALRREGSPEVVGHAAAMPRRVMVDGAVRRAWIGGDFSVLPAYRTLGLALRLRRAAREAVDAGEVDLFYSFPNERMELIHAKAGHQLLGRLERLARPVRSGPYLARHWPRPVAALLAPPVDLILRLRSPKRAPRDCLVAHVGRARLDERYDRLCLTAALDGGIVPLKDARYLEWRYLQQPGWAGAFTEVTRHGELVGYAAGQVEQGVFSVTDAVALDSGVALALATALVSEARRRDQAGVSFPLLGQGSATRAGFYSAGFRPRVERAAVYVYAGGAIRDFAQPDRWYLVTGDRDV